MKDTQEIRRYPMKSARTNFTELMTEVQGGARVVITKGGRPVVDVVPHDPFAATMPLRIWPDLVPLKPGLSIAAEVAATRGDR